jgi:hypothetical protein
MCKNTRIISNMSSSKLELLKKQRIITDPEDLVATEIKIICVNTIWVNTIYYQNF